MMLTNYIKIYILCLVLLLFASPSWAAMPVNPSYVASDGNGTSCTLVAPCTLSYANTNAEAGDVVNLRGGTYAITANYGRGINPSNSGSEGSLITFQSYEEEVPLLQGSDDPRTQYGVTIGGSYVKVTGINFENFWAWGFITAPGSYNEISYCKFYNTRTVSSSGLNITNIYDDEERGSTHNWIHHNEFYRSGDPACGEGSDLVKIGSATAGDYNSNYNTIENNIIYSAGHTLTEDFGMYNVWRNNVGHNEGWKAFGGVYGTATGGSNASLIDTSVNFSTAGVAAGHHIFSMVEMIKKATVTSISTTTNDNDTLNYTTDAGAYGTPTFSAGQGYVVSSCDYAPDPVGSNPGNGKYGHRNFSMTGSESGPLRRYNLFEGNRSGYASINPNNNGADGLTLGSPGNIVRYNSFFGSDGPGICLKHYGGEGFAGARNMIYNNTMYKNGQYIVGHSNTTSKNAIQFYGTSSKYNYFNNNLMYLNGTSYIDLGGGAFVYGQHVWGNNWCTNDVEGCTVRSGDPLFLNPDMSDMTSTTLPNLGLQSNSTAINGGTQLTLANGAGNNTTALIVDDNTSLFFQDGTWGSSLSNIQADWIAIGTVTNVVQIDSIDYANNIIYLKEPKSWADDAPIWLYKKSDGTRVLYGSAPDYGAYEYVPSTTGAQSLSGGSLGGGAMR